MRVERRGETAACCQGSSEPDLVWINIREVPFTVYGVEYNTAEARYVRMPVKRAEKVSEKVAYLNGNTAGGRVRFCTDSGYIAIRAVMKGHCAMAHMPLTGSSGFDLYRTRDGKEEYYTTFTPPMKEKGYFPDEGYFCGTKTYGELAEYTINFPLYDHVSELYVGLEEGAELLKASPYQYEKPVVFYGSSITQGGCASRPGNSYQGFLSRMLSTDYVNLGFSGAGMGETAMAEYVSEFQMSALVMDYDSNAPSTEALQETHELFFKTVRAKQPELPIIMISHSAALHRVFYETRAAKSWGTFDDRRAVIYHTYETAVSEGDTNVYFVDGREIYQGEEWDGCTVDGTHPNDLGFLRYAQRLAKVLGPIFETYHNISENSEIHSMSSEGCKVRLQ